MVGWLDGGAPSAQAAPSDADAVTGAQRDPTQLDERRTSGAGSNVEAWASASGRHGTMRIVWSIFERDFERIRNDSGGFERWPSQEERRESRGLPAVVLKGGRITPIDRGDYEDDPASRG
ncbi:hypothetical protein KM043_006115 [Ampulex compressa]|nr:hypothetical protein KM043_006115 [Ampulex compressa]